MSEQFADTKALDAFEAQAQRQAAKRENMVRLTKDGDLVKVRLSTNRIEIAPSDFTKGKNDWLFHFKSEDGSMKYLKFSPKWGTTLYQMLKASGKPESDVLITRNGLGVNDTVYTFEII